MFYRVYEIWMELARTSHTLRPTLQSTLNNLPFLFTELLNLKEMYNLICVSKDFTLIAREYIDAYIRSRVAPRISLYLEGIPISFGEFGLVGRRCDGWSRSSCTTMMFKLRQPRYLHDMPGSHGIRCEIKTGRVDRRRVTTTKSLLFHDFSTGFKSCTVCTPISLFSRRKIYLTWADLVGTDAMSSLFYLTQSTPLGLIPSHEICSRTTHHHTLPRTTYAGTMGDRWYTKLFRYITRWRDKRQHIDSVPCITHIAMDVPSTFFSPDPVPISALTRVVAIFGFLLSNTVIHLLGVCSGYSILGIIMCSTRHIVSSISHASV